MHAQIDWPEGGGIMLGDARDDDTWPLSPGGAGLYVVTDRVDELHERAVAAGAKIVRPLASEDYGNRQFAVQYPDGNLWSFGTYRGAPRP